jgi:hypothetical protein
MIPKWLKAVVLVVALALLGWAVWTQIEKQQPRTTDPPAASP